MSSDAIDPFELDRRLARTAGEWWRWRRKLARGEGLNENPFETSGALTRRVTLDAVRGLPASDPLRPAFERWIFRLLEQRMNHAVLVARATARRIEEHVLDAPEHTKLPPAEMLARALREPARRNVWLSAYQSTASTLSRTEALLWERRHEIASKLELESFDALDPGAAAIVESASEWLRRTDDSASEWHARDLGTVIGTALGEDARLGWPARLTLRSLTDYFRETRLFDDLRLDPDALPEPIAASSFMRGLAEIGAAFVDALTARNRPFAVARDPRALPQQRFAALFGLLPASPAFARRAQGLGDGAARDQRRVLARVILLESRGRALRVLLRSSALGGAKAFGAAFEENVLRTFGCHVPPAAAGALWRLSVGDPQRFAGLLLAAGDGARLVEAHDEDWYRNPRAAEELRAHASMPREPDLQPVELTSGADELWRALSAALG